MSDEPEERGAAAPAGGWRPALVVAVLAYAGLVPLVSLKWSTVRLLLPVVCLALGWGWQCGAGRVRRAAGALLGLEAAVFLVLAGTPLAPKALIAYAARDAPSQADLIVVLSSGGTFRHLGPTGRERLLHGLTMYADGRGRQLMFTGSGYAEHNGFDGAALDLMRRLGIDIPVLPFHHLDPARIDTHAEALSVAALAPPGGWGKVVVVTSPAHTRRAVMAFRAVGLDAYVEPSSTLVRAVMWSPVERLEAFRSLSFELIALAWYRWRGWA